MNEPQREAVQHPGGPLLILAGAGSGKTRVLTHCIAWLLATRRVKPHQVLAITFTNKAAEEMRARASALTGHSSGGLWLMTFHSACARILRRDGHALGYTPTFTIYDTADSRRVIKRLLGAGAGEDSEQAGGGARGVHDEISAAKNQMLGVEQWLAQHSHPDLAGTTAQVWHAYDAELRHANALDFDDLLLATRRLLAEHHDIAEEYRRRFAHVVDEYQDTNQVQYQLLKQLIGVERNLTAVGDIDQAIYSFRQADIRNILSFETDFADAAVIKLEQNYRSTRAILDAASAVIAHNTQRRPKTLWTDKDGGRPVQVHALATSDDRPTSPSRSLATIATPAGRLGDVAVLYRTNSQSQPFEEALAAHGLPYQMAGTLRFYERAESRTPSRICACSQTLPTTRRLPGSLTCPGAISATPRSTASASSPLRPGRRCSRPPVRPQARSASRAPPASSRSLTCSMTCAPTPRSIPGSPACSAASMTAPRWRPRRPATSAPTAAGRTCCNCSALPPAMTPNTPTAERSASCLRRWRSLVTLTAWRASATRWP